MVDYVGVVTDADDGRLYGGVDQGDYVDHEDRKVHWRVSSDLHGMRHAL